MEPEPSLTDRCPTGIEHLDLILNGGLPRNRLYLLQGRPGLGKTTFALQFLREGARLGETGLYITLSETHDELLEVANSHAWNLQAFHVLELSHIERSLGEVSDNSFFHPSELELNKTAQVLLDEVERVKPHRVVLDSLSEFRLLAEMPLRYRRQMLKLKQYFAGRRSTVLLLDDQAGESGDFHIQSIAHGVITLDRLAMNYGANRRQLTINKMRGLKFREGAHDYLIEKGGLRVFPRISTPDEASHDFDTEPLASGVEGLDLLLDGGLDRGTSNLFIGPAGCGKSTIAFQFAQMAAGRGEQCVVFSFDENRQILTSRGAGPGRDLPTHLESGLIRVQHVDPAELSPGQFCHLVRDAVQKEQARVVVIDSLNGYLNAMPDEKFLSLQLHELLTFLSHCGVVTIMTVAQHGLVGNMQAPVDVTYLSDTVLLLRFFEAQGQVKKAISIIKKRSGNHEDTIRELKIEPNGIRIGQPLTEFHGILTGIPTFHGKTTSMLKTKVNGQPES